ncbi:protein serine threonine phosphatase : Protein serine/threonine phosphatase OS=Pedosphaera parvula (strain Ellin514) GN=Cflav_PD6463 PE=4 SV=1: SpoIIE [Gemmataceae bacterium]|nr:protein serine threonine phosphatase : Protein serine/threonine phosphatase OS=Pedosphaera parvula (strain Ellin514) GN=Cflav_PD6463 PE=4 SV=1: SpoIIE [Gemmataceae bacterium]VTU02160.1 protein serine threonine phosphatase : Protein serine/threonine phosphatase OS=Pedosphaera parvula (strain Ellin514) GN=Cflav_PD6463 PE=4 SV=1: SpoIIE [Gemmataceae bacterium]
MRRGRAGRPLRGERAARLACDCIASGRDPREADAIVAADPEAGFTTLVAFGVTSDAIEGVSCGDSAVLLVCGSGAVAELTQYQHKNPPVGSGEAVFVSFEMPLVTPWKVLAMTDGVWKYAGWDRVRGLASRLGGEELLAALRAAARLPRSGQFPDDFTVVLIEADWPQCIALLKCCRSGRSPRWSGPTRSAPPASRTS